MHTTSGHNTVISILSECRRQQFDFVGEVPPLHPVHVYLVEGPSQVVPLGVPDDRLSVHLGRLPRTPLHADL